MHTGSNSDAEISNNFINQLNVLSIISVNYSLVKYENKMGKNAGESKFYARAQVHESITLKMFSKLISMQTTVSRADVSAVLVSAVENLVMELQRGNQVEFGELGKFRLQLTSEGVEKASDFKGDIHIKGVNIQFVPGDDLSTLFENLEFTQVASRAVRRLPSRLRRKEPRPSTSRRRRRRARRPRALILAPALQALALRIQAAPNQAVET